MSTDWDFEGRATAYDEIAAARLFGKPVIPLQYTLFIHDLGILLDCQLQDIVFEGDSVFMVFTSTYEGNPVNMRLGGGNVTDKTYWLNLKEQVKEAKHA